MTYKTVRDALTNILGVDEALVAPDTPLWRGMDIVSLAKLILLCERRFNITIRDEHIPNLRTLRDLVRLIETLRLDGVESYAQPSDTAREAWYYE